MKTKSSPTKHKSKCTANTTLSGERLNGFPMHLRANQEASLSSLFYSAQYWKFYLVKLVCCCCCCCFKKIKDEIHRCKSNKNMSRICVLKTIKHGCKKSKQNYMDVNNRFIACKTRNR